MDIYLRKTSEIMTSSQSLSHTESKNTCIVPVFFMCDWVITLKTSMNSVANCGYQAQAVLRYHKLPFISCCIFASPDVSPSASPPNKPSLTVRKPALDDPQTSPQMDSFSGPTYSTSTETLFTARYVMRHKYLKTWKIKQDTCMTT